MNKVIVKIHYYGGVRGEYGILGEIQGKQLIFEAREKLGKMFSKNLGKNLVFKHKIN